MKNSKSKALNPHTKDFGVGINTLPREILPNLSFKIPINVENNFRSMVIEDSFISQGEQIQIFKLKCSKLYFEFWSLEFWYCSPCGIFAIYSLWNTHYLPLVEYSLFTPCGILVIYSTGFIPRGLSHESIPRGKGFRISIL